MSKLDRKGCPQIGSRKQHAYVVLLAEKIGYRYLINAVAEAASIKPESITKHSRFGPAQATAIIEYLSGKLHKVKAERAKLQDA